MWMIGSFLFWILPKRMQILYNSKKISLTSVGGGCELKIADGETFCSKI